MTGQFVWLLSGVNGIPHRVADDQAVIASFVARGFELTGISGEIPSDSEEFQVELAKLQAGDQVADLKGKALDAALDEAGLSKSGTVEEKRARLAEHEAAEITTPAESATDQEEEIE